MVLVCRIADRDLAMDLRFVDEVFRTGYVTPIPKAPSCFVGLTNLRGRVIPVIDPANLISSTPASRPIPGRMAVLVSWSRLRAALLVDQVVGVVTTTPGGFVAADDTSLLAGSLGTERGRIELIHVERLLREAAHRSAQQAAQHSMQVES